MNCIKLYITYGVIRINTLPKTNIAPENQLLEDVYPFGMAYFQVLCLFQGVYHHWLTEKMRIRRISTKPANLERKPLGWKRHVGESQWLQLPFVNP